MASQTPAGSGSTSKQEFKIRVPRTQKHYGVMKFSAPKSVDFAQIKHVTLQRENNFNHFKQAHDLDTMPKYGAGSEFGREQREEARRKKYGIVTRRYNPHSQPWHLKVGTGKQTKKFKGSKEGSVSEHSSYFVLQRGSDGSFFDAYPVEEWHSFTPEVSFSYLNSEEAEDAFSRRAKIVNHHHIMVQKRLRDAEKDDDDPGKGSDNEKEQSKQKRKSLMLTEMDDWVDSDDMDEDDEGADADAEDDEEKSKSKAKKTKVKKSTKKWKKEGRRNSDDEAIEDSDDGDEEGQEMDYDTDHSSSENEVDVEEDKYNVKGVEDEEGLKKLNESGSSSSEHDSNKDDNEDDDDAPPSRKAESDMSSTSSEGGSDAETVPLKSSSSSSSVPKSSQNSEKSGPSVVKEVQMTERVDRKRKAAATPPVDSKRNRVDSPKTVPPPRSEELTEAAMRMYLQFKPMTAKELLKRFKHERQRLSKEELQEKFSMIMRKIEPQQRMNSEGKRVFYLPQSQGS